MRKATCRYLLAACLFLPGIPPGAAAVPVPSDYLFVWAMEGQFSHATMPMLERGTPDLAMWRKDQGLGKDFLAVFDIRPGASFGSLVTTLPVGEAAMAHHTNYAEPADDVLYANDWLANRTYVFDLHDARHPRLARDFGSVGAYSYPHSFVHLTNGNTLATFQYSGGYNHAPGGLVEFDPQGRVVRTASAAVPGKPNIRPYSLTVVASLHRVVTTSADMMGAQSSNVVQVWRLPDLKLIKTMQLPRPKEVVIDDTAADSSEPRVLADGKTVVVPTFNCGLFLVRDLAGDTPTLQHVYDFGYRTCEVPGRILLPPDEYPHWLALEPGGDRLAITGYGTLQTHLRFATVDRRSGQLKLEPSSIDFTRAWPDGWQGSAIPHGVVFSNP